MSFRTLDIAGLPDGVQVRSSSRRRKTVTASREAGVTIVTVPAGMPAARIRPVVDDLLRKIDRRSHRGMHSDAYLATRAEALRQKYLPEAPPPLTVRWSDRQRRRWGSCTPTDCSIRISGLLRDAPDYVVDSVLVHELAHLIHSNHSAAFHALVARYPDLERANAFLAGIEFARATGLTPGAPNED